MYFRIIHVLVVAFSILVNTQCDKNVTQETKSKRGIHNVVDGGEYALLPAQHIGTYSQVRALAPDETPLIDITYKSLENGNQNQYIPFSSDQAKLTSDNAFEAQTYHPQNLNYQALLQSSPQLYQTQPLQSLPIYRQPITIPQHNTAGSTYVGSAYPITLNNKYSNPLTPFVTQKSIQVSGTPLNRNNQLKLNSYAAPITAVPSLYGSGNQNSGALKFNQPLNLQYNLPVQSHSISQQSLKLIQPYHIKPPHKIVSQNQYRPQKSSSPIFQISQNFKALEPNFFNSHAFENPQISQLQNFPQHSQSSFDTFVNPGHQTTSQNIAFKPSLQIKHPKTQHNNEDESDEDEDEEEIVNKKVKEEIKGEIYSQEINDEDEFDKGYHDAARGFPAYDHDDDDDDYSRSNYKHDDKHGRYQDYKTSSRYNDDDHDDHGDVDYHSYKAYPNNYEGINHYYRHQEPEGHYSDKNNKKEPRGHSHKGSYKYHKKNESDTYRKMPKKQHTKKYNSNKSTPYRKQTDSKYAGDTLRIRNAKTPTRTQSSLKHSTSAQKSGKLSFSSTEPNYQYGFEPIHTPYPTEKQNIEDQEGKYSESPLTKKLYKENWYISKTKEM